MQTTENNSIAPVSNNNTWIKENNFSLHTHPQSNSANWTHQWTWKWLLHINSHTTSFSKTKDNIKEIQNKTIQNQLNSNLNIFSNSNQISTNPLELYITKTKITTFHIENNNSQVNKDNFSLHIPPTYWIQLTKHINEQDNWLLHINPHITSFSKTN